jgi:hypothetical protein
MDRDTDMISLMVTPLTYEGLIDDLYGFNNGNVALPGARMYINVYVYVCIMYLCMCIYLRGTNRRRSSKCIPTYIHAYIHTCSHAHTHTHM